jgi:hypothetical protein
MIAHRKTRDVHVHSLYVRGYRLYNRLCGTFAIRDHHEDTKYKKLIRPLPNGPHMDLPHVGVVILEGWISA